MNGQSFFFRFSMIFVAFFLFTGIFPFQEAMADDLPRVRLETTMGNIVVELYEDDAPITVANFLRYVDEGFYNGTIFHRVISEFVIQGGGFDNTLTMKETLDPIVNEAGNGLSNRAYTIAMARTSDPDSATSQFYINLVDNFGLDPRVDNPGYAVFGLVVEGRNVVDAIGLVETTTTETFENLPVQSIRIEKAARVETEDGGSSGSCFLKGLTQ